MINLIAAILSAVVAMAMMVAYFMYRICHPELTETQLLIRFWWLSIPLASLFFICAICFGKWERSRNKETPDGDIHSPGGVR